MSQRTSVHNERPISPTSELGKDRPKLDIQIERCGIRPKRFYTFEAKRLRDDERATSSASLKHYFGDDGVGRFIEGKYDRDRIEAAMLGCIQARDPSFWLEQVKRIFEEDTVSKPERFNIVEGFQRCSIIPEIANETATLHRRSNGTMIRLLHILLDCT